MIIIVKKDNFFEFKNYLQYLKEQVEKIFKGKKIIIILSYIVKDKFR